MFWIKKKIYVNLNKKGEMNTVIATENEYIKIFAEIRNFPPSPGKKLIYENQNRRFVAEIARMQPAAVSLTFAELLKSFSKVV